MLKTALITVPVTLLAVLIVGCNKPTSTTTNKAGDKKLSLTKPSDQSVTRGEGTEIVVKISREGFRDPVSVTFDNLPTGVEPKDKDNKIAAEQTSGTFTLHAKAEATPVTNHEVRVTATGPDGMKMSETFKLTVKDKSN